MVTAKERLLKVLDGEAADRPPCICPGGRSNVVTAALQDEVGVHFPQAHCDARKMAALAKAVYDKGLFESFGVPFCGTVEAEAMGASVVLGTQTAGPHITSGAAFHVRDWRQISPIDLETGRVKVVLDAIRILSETNGDVPVIVGLAGPVTVAASAMDFYAYNKHLRKRKDLSHQYMEFVTSELIRYGCAQIRAGADVIVVNESLSAHEIMGPVLFREYSVPYVEKLQRALREAGARTIVYCFGRVPSDLPAVSCISSNALAFDSGLSMAAVRKGLPGRVIVGGVPAAAIEKSDAETVRAIVRGFLVEGADIIAPEYGVGMDSPTKNIGALLEAVKEAT